MSGDGSRLFDESQAAVTARKQASGKMSLRRRIIIEVEDREFRRHDKQIRSHIKDTRRGIGSVGTEFKKQGGVIGNSLLQSNKQLGRFGGLLSQIGTSASGVFGVITAGFTAVIAAMGAGVSEAIKYQAALVDVQKTTGLTDAELNVLGDNLLSLSGRLGTSRTELAQIAEVAGQLGINGTSNITAFTETVAKLVRVTELSAQEAGSAIARIANVFNVPIQQVDKIGSVLNELSNTSTAKAGDIAGALNRIGKSGDSLGLTVDQVAALSTVLIDSGIVAERGGTALRNIFIRIQSKAGELAAQMGITREEFTTLIEEDALAGIRAYLETLGDLPPALRAVKIKEVFGDENFLAVLTLTEQTDMLNDVLATSQEAFNAGTSLNDEFARTLRSVSAQWDIFTSRVGAASVELGQKFLPLLDDVIRGANQFAERFDTPAERLLSTLQKIDGIDPEVLANVEATVSRQALQGERAKIEESLAELEVITASTVENSFRARLGSLLKGGAGFGKDFAESVTTGFITSFETAKISELTSDELDRIEAQARARVLALSEDIENAQTGRGSEGNRIKLELEFQEDIIRAVEETRRLESELVGINEAIKQIGQTKQEAGQVVDETDGGGNDDDKDPVFSEEQRQKALEFIRKLQQANQVRARFTESEREALEEVLSIQDEIAKIREAEAITGKAAAADVLSNAERRLAIAEESLRSAEAFRAKIAEAAREFENLGASSAGVQGPLDSFFEALGEDKVRELSELFEVTKDGARVTSAALRQIPKSVLDQIEELSDKPGGKTRFQAMAEAAGELADSVSSILRLANVFGDLSGEAVAFGESIIDAAREVERMNSLIEQNGSLTLGQGIAGFAGIAGAGFSAASAIADAINRDREEKQERIAAQKLLREQLEANEVAIKRNTDALLGGARVGAGISQGEIDSAQGLISDFLSGNSLRGGGRGGRGSGASPDLVDNFRGFLGDLDAIGIEGLSVSDFEERLQLGLQSGADPRAIISEILSEIESVLREVDVNLGGFGNSVEGAVESLRFFSQFLSEDAQTQLERFVNFLLTNVEGLPDGLRDALAEVGSLDLSTEGGRERVNQIIAAVAAAIDSGSFNFGDLTPAEVDEILSTLQGLAEGAESQAGASGDDFSRSVQIARTITKIQANEVIALLESQLFTLQSIDTNIARMVDAITAPNNFALPDSVFQPRDPAGVTIGSVNVNAGFDEAQIPALMIAIESELRRASRGGLRA